jgi:hypothetical protein
MEVKMMKEHMADLNILAKKYHELIESLENQLVEAKRKFTVVSEAIELLKKEGVFDQDKLFKIHPIISERYKDMSMKKAIEDILGSNEHKKLSAEDIHSELLKHCYESKSKNLKRDVYSRLFRMEENGILISIKEDGRKKYLLPEKEVKEKELRE